MQFDSQPQKKNDRAGSLATVSQELSEEDSELESPKLDSDREFFQKNSTGQMNKHSLGANISHTYGGDKEALVEQKAENILFDMQYRIELAKPTEKRPEGVETMTKLMKRIKRLDKQSEKVNRPMFSGYGLDP